MGKWVTFLYAYRCHWVTMEKIAPPYMSERWVFIGDGPDKAREVEKFLGFGFMLWESDKAEKGMGNEKRETVGKCVI